MSGLLQSLNHKLFRWLPLLAFALAGCTRNYDADVIRLPCGNGELVLHERYARHFSYSRAHFELRFVEGRKHRVLDRDRTHVSLYTRPEPAEDYQVLRASPADGIPGRPDGAGRLWAVFVDPNQFSRAEYTLIRQTLASNLPAIDTALARKREPLVSLEQDRRPVLISIRYVDVGARQKLYTGKEPLRLEVEPQGSLKLIFPQRLSDGKVSSMQITTWVGLVVDNGRSVLLHPSATNDSPGSWSLADLQQCRDARGRTLFDDFTVTIARSRGEYQEAEARMDDREQVFHDFIWTYPKVFRHPSRPLSLRISSENAVTLTGTHQGEPLRRQFGYVADRGTTLLVPGPNQPDHRIAAFRPIPGVPDRRAFAAECKDDQGRSILDLYRWEITKDEDAYARRAEAAHYGR